MLTEARTRSARFTVFVHVILTLGFLNACGRAPMNGQELFDHGRYAEAAQSFRAEAEQNPGHAAAAGYSEARALYLMRDWAGSARCLDRLLATAASSGIRERAATLRAYCHYSLGEYDQARSLAKQTLLQANLDDASRLDLAQLLGSIAEHRGELFVIEELIDKGQFDSAALLASTLLPHVMDSPLRLDFLSAWLRAMSGNAGVRASEETDTVLAMLEALPLQASDLGALNELSRVFLRAGQCRATLEISKLTENLINRDGPEAALEASRLAFPTKDEVLENASISDLPTALDLIEGKDNISKISAVRARIADQQDKQARERLSNVLIELLIRENQQAEALRIINETDTRVSPTTRARFLERIDIERLFNVLDDSPVVRYYWIYLPEDGGVQ